MIGQKFGRLLVISKGTRSGEQSFKWLCKCDCGKERYVRADHLKSGRTVSCGCKRTETRRLLEMSKPEYGLRNHPLYDVWCSMRQRCNDVNATSYVNYGGRGIKVCADWNNFKLFCEWAITNGWQSNLQIDRKDNNGNYNPDNCRFVTAKINSNNRRSNILVTLNGQLLTLKQACEKLSLNDKLIRQRIKRDKYSFEQAILL